MLEFWTAHHAAEGFLADGRSMIARQKLLLGQIRRSSVYPDGQCDKLEAKLRTFELELNVFEQKVLAAARPKEAPLGSTLAHVSKVTKGSDATTIELTSAGRAPMHWTVPNVMFARLGYDVGSAVGLSLDTSGNLIGVSQPPVPRTKY